MPLHGLRCSLAALGLLLTASLTHAAPAEDGPAAATRNVLFIAVDDLRPELGPYGVARAITPSLDALAERGLTFTRAYCQAALCAPSRTSLLTGLRPGRPGITARDSMKFPLIRRVATEALTLPEQLKNHGVATLTVGKIFHNYETQNPDDWTKQVGWGGGGYQSEANIEREQTFKRKLREEGPRAKWKYQRGPASEAADKPASQHPDHRIASRGIELMAEAGEDPWFVAVGFFKPHLPFVAPKEFWDLHDRDAIEVPSREEPGGMAEYALVPSWYETRMYGDIPRKGPLNDAKTRELIHGYLACVSFIDAQIGRLLDDLEKSGHADDTTVIVWGDHGFKLGDFGDWSKYTNMEIDTRVPLMVAGPGVAAGDSDAFVELIDLYPTVSELLGVPVPEHVEGDSFVPLLTDPARPWKAAAFSYYDRENPDGEGFSVRSGDLRYTEWRAFETGEMLARELYDHAENPIADRNLADDPAHAADLARMQRLLEGGWEAARPPASAQTRADPPPTTTTLEVRWAIEGFLRGSPRQ